MKLIVLFLLVFILAFPFPVRAQSSDPYTEPCDQLPLHDWKTSSKFRLQDGACVLNDTGLEPISSLTDFTLSFKLRFEKNGKLEFHYGTSMNDEYVLSITPTEASLINYIRYGNASSTVNDTLLAKASLSLTTTEWVEVEYGMQAQKQWLKINHASVLERTTARFYSVSIYGVKAGLDDIQLVRADLSAIGEKLNSYPSGLAQTWIAYLTNHQELAITHADGTRKTIIASPVLEGYSIRPSFSPSGKFLAVARGGLDHTLLTFYDLEVGQFIGAEIRLRRNPQFDWLPDSQHLIVLNDSKPTSPSFDKIDILDGQVKGSIPFPVHVDQSAFQVRSVSSMDCSPQADTIAFIADGVLDGQNVRRPIMFDLSSALARFLPGTVQVLWSPDGHSLFSAAGGLIDAQTLAFTDFPQEMVDMIHLSGRNFVWSPNSQFIRVGSENSGQEKYSVFVIDLNAQSAITIPLMDLSAWAPDSLHFVLSDSGRIIVHSLFNNNDELQIAEGFSPIWQPVPALVPSEPVKTPQPAATSTKLSKTVVVETQQPTLLATNTETFLPPASLSQPQPIYPISNSWWPIVLLVLGMAVVGLASFIVWRRSFRICPACRRSSRGKDPFCMYCGKLLPITAQGGSIFIKIALGASIFLILLGGGGLIIRLFVSEVESAQPYAVSLETQPQEPQADQVTATIFEPSLPVNSGLVCGNLDLTQADLLAVMKEIEMSAADLTNTFKILGDLERIDPTQQPEKRKQAETQAAGLVQQISSTCSLTFVGISPDLKYILLSGGKAANAPSPTSTYWSILYDRKTYAPLWVQPIVLQLHPFSQTDWNASGDKFAVSLEGNISIYETATGNLLSKVPASTRQDAACSPKDLRNNQFRWLPDGNRLIRKIANAVQVLDAKTGKTLSEIAFNDSVFGSGYSPDHIQCTFAFAWSPSGDRFATLGTFWESDPNPSYELLKLWNADSGKLFTENKLAPRYRTSILFSPIGDVMLINGMTTSLPELFDTQTGQLVQELPGSPASRPSGGIIWSPDGGQILMRTDQNLGLYNRRSGVWRSIGSSSSGYDIQSWFGDGTYVLYKASNATNGFAVLDTQTGRSFSMLEYFQSVR